MKVKIEHVDSNYPMMTPGKITPSDPIIYVLEKPYHESAPNSRFWLRCHKCGLTANLGDHEVTLEGESITISPSILCPRKTPQECGAHYYIKNSEISY